MGCFPSKEQLARERKQLERRQEEQYQRQEQQRKRQEQLGKGLEKKNKMIQSAMSCCKKTTENQRQVYIYSPTYQNQQPIIANIIHYQNQLQKRQALVIIKIQQQSGLKLAESFGNEGLSMENQLWFFSKCQKTDADYRSLSRHNLNITKLFLASRYGQQVSCAGVSSIFQAPWQYLQELNLGNSNLGNEVCSYIAKGKWQLRKLWLHGNKIDVEGCSIFQQEQLWKRKLELFCLNANPIGSDGLYQLTRTTWPALNELHLGFCQIEEDGCGYFASLNAPNLTRLHIQWNGISEGLKHLREGKWNLEELVVSIKFNTHFGWSEETNPEKRDRNRRCSHFMSISNMGTIMFGQKGCYWLSQLKGRQEQPTQTNPGQGRSISMNEVPRQRLGGSRLKVLDLGQAMLSSRKSYKLLSRGQWPLLQQIYLDSNILDQKGICHLSKSCWPQLRVLVLDISFLDKSCLKWLSRGNWMHMTNLDIIMKDIKDALEKQSRWLTKMESNVLELNLKGNKNIMQRSLNCLRSKVKKINYQFDERYV